MADLRRSTQELRRATLEWEAGLDAAVESSDGEVREILERMRYWMADCPPVTPGPPTVTCDELEVLGGSQGFARDLASLFSDARRLGLTGKLVESYIRWERAMCGLADEVRDEMVRDAIKEVQCYGPTVMRDHEVVVRESIYHLPSACVVLKRCHDGTDERWLGEYFEPLSKKPKFETTPEYSLTNEQLRCYEYADLRPMYHSSYWKDERRRYEEVRQTLEALDDIAGWSEQQHYYWAIRVVRWVLGEGIPEVLASQGFSGEAARVAAFMDEEGGFSGSPRHMRELASSVADELAGCYGATYEELMKDANSSVDDCVSRSVHFAGEAATLLCQASDLLGAGSGDRVRGVLADAAREAAFSVHMGGRAAGERLLIKAVRAWRNALE